MMDRETLQAVLWQMQTIGCSFNGADDDWESLRAWLVDALASPAQTPGVETETHYAVRHTSNGWVFQVCDSEGRECDIASMANAHEAALALAGHLAPSPEPAQDGARETGPDLDVVKRAYGWTFDVDGQLCGLTAGDMGYEDARMWLDHRTKTWVDELSAFEDERIKIKAEITRLQSALAQAEQERDALHAANREMGAALDAIDGALIDAGARQPVMPEQYRQAIMGLVRR